MQTNTNTSEASTPVQEIPNLASRLNWANNAYIGLLTLTVIASVLIVWYSKKLNTAKDEQYAREKQTSDERIAQLTAEAENAKKERAQADLKIEEARERASKADERAGEANERAGKAKERAEEIAKENLELKGELDRSNEAIRLKTEELRAQNLSTEARLEYERRTRLDLEKYLAPRSIPFWDENRKETFTPLRAFKGTRVLLVVTLDAEPRRLAGRIKSILEASGWQVLGVVPDVNLTDGVTVRGKSYGEDDGTLAAANALDEFLRDNDIEIHRFSSTNPNGSPKEGFPANAVVVQIGLKPDTYFDRRDWLKTMWGMHPRGFKPEMRHSIASLLKSMPKAPLQISCPAKDVKACAFAEELSAVLTEAGWKIEGGKVKSVDTYLPPGVTILARNDPTPSPIRGFPLNRPRKFADTTPAERLLSFFGLIFEVNLDKRMEIPAPFIGIWVGPEQEPEQ